MQSFFKCANPGLFLFIFVLFNQHFTEKCRLRRDLNWNCQSRRQARWPLDHHHGHNKLKNINYKLHCKISFCYRAYECVMRKLGYVTVTNRTDRVSNVSKRNFETRNNDYEKITHCVFVHFFFCSRLVVCFPLFHLRKRTKIVFPSEPQNFLNYFRSNSPSSSSSSSGTLQLPG